MSLILTLYTIQNNINIMFKKESFITTFIILGLVGVTNAITYCLTTTAETTSYSKSKGS
jgi:hypothetical protein